MIVERGRRSSLVMEGGCLYRVYTDTGIRTPCPLSLDERGTVRISHNRTLSSVEEETYRGAERRAPLHIQTAKHILLSQKPLGIVNFSLLCSVKENTAWSYACSIVEYFPSLCEEAKVLVYPPLLSSLLLVDRRGTLSSLMERVEDGPLGTDSVWKKMENRFSHLRLGRICLMEE